MRCLLIIRNPSLPDVVFMWTDDEFKHHITRSAVDRGLLEPDEVSGNLDIGVITQYFSPIIASHGSLTSELNCPYFSITCNNGFLFVIKQFDQHLFITVNGDGQESEKFLHKKLLVFHRIIQFFFGPATEQLRRNNIDQRDALWARLGSILDSWCDLYHRDQSFLVEGVERLQVNQTLNHKCITLLESVLLKFRSAGDKNAVHAMLITGTRLLSLYSSRNAGELDASDQLLIFVLVRALFSVSSEPLQDGQADADPPQSGDQENRHSGVLSDGEFLSAGEGGGSDGSNYYSPTGSHDEHSPTLLDHPGPRGPLATLPKMDEQGTSEDSHTDSWCDLTGGAGMDTANIPSLEFTPKKKVAEPPISQTIWYTPIEDLRKMQDTSSNGLSFAPDDQTGSGTPSSCVPPAAAPPRPTLTDPSAGHQSRTTATPPPSPSSSSSESSRRVSKEERAGVDGDAVQMAVFLRQTCPYTPHILHMVHILPSIVLVIISEVNGQVASSVSNCSGRLNVLSNAIYRSDVVEALHKQSSVGKLDADIKQLGNAVKKLKVQGLQQGQTDLQKQWTIAKGCGLTTNQASTAMTTRLESSLSEMSKILKTIFQSCYINCNAPLVRPPSRYRAVVGDIKASLNEALSYYDDYLAVKAERNITMTNYLEDFPGLVHFIHVNRNTNHLKAPSINVSCEAERADLGKRLLQEKVWRMVERVYAQLPHGSITEMVRQGDFTYSYNLLFEDANGPLPQPVIPRATRYPVPGIIAGKFFREVADYAFPNASHGSLSCYELFCIHLSVVPTAMINGQMRRLQTILSNGEAVTPVNLL